MIPWINIAKGIGILLIVYGHSYPPEILYHFFYYFHIPLFFFISGYLFNKTQPVFEQFFIHKFKTLMIPFYVYGFFMTLLIFILHWYRDDLNPEIVIHYLSGLLNARERNLANTDLWFLPSLFLTSISAYIILQKIPRRTLFSIILFIIVVGMIYMTDRKGNSIYSITTVPSALFFFIAGFYYRKLDFYIEKTAYSIVYFLFVIIVFTVSYKYFHQTVDIGANYFGRSVLLMLINGLLGTMLVIFLSRKIGSNGLLEYFGKISLYIFIFHQIFVPVTDAFNHMFDLQKHFLIIGTVKLLGSILLYELIVKALKKKIPYL